VIRDGRRFWRGGLVVLPTLRVCMKCGATWDQAMSVIQHLGPHDPNERAYNRASLWPRERPSP
jgi:hypothetical protein